MSEQKVISVIEEPVHITLTKNARGIYQWDISVHAKTPEEALKTIQEVDEALRVKYATQGGEQA